MTARRQRESGYALLILMMVVTILLVSLTAALPSAYVEGQREREEELIFRGNEYARAIALFHRRFNRYPSNVKELIRTNGIRFLRHAYSDPMSRDGKWRLIHMAANGVVLDSHTLSSPNQPTPGKPGASSDSNSGSSFFQRSGSSSPLQDGTRRSRFSLSSSSDEAGRPGRGFVSDSNEEVGAFIVGVASSSTKESFKLWKDRTHYDEWEFLGTEVNFVPANVGGQAPGGTGQQVGPGSPGSRFPTPPRRPGFQPMARGETQ